ncbi:MAG: 30S ribosome-binding factor RbfA [Candidatus Omnitrophica bacterium]|nr:30S ribosome-binding factor RbfA [Candidatus Omnitrophota bacterium]
MQGKRTDRVGHLLQMELGKLVLHKIKDPRLGFVTITHVNVSPDLKSARVFYSRFGDAKERKETQQVLERAAGFLQREIGKALQMKNTPKLTFSYDPSIEKGFEIDRVLKDLKDKGEMS